MLKKITRILFKRSDIVLLVLILSIWKSFRNKSNRNLYNFLTVLFVCLTILTRLSCLIYSLSTFTLNWGELQQYFFFEVPFNFIITASMVQFFQWLQFAAFIYKSGEEQAKVYEHKRYRLLMLTVLLASTLALALKLIAVVNDQEL